VADLWVQNWVEAIEVLKPKYGTTLDYRLQALESVSRCAINRTSSNMYTSYIQWNLNWHHFPV